MLGNPEEANVNSITYGVLVMLEFLLGSPQAQLTVANKLRSAGVDSFRYLMDNPLVQIAEFGLDSRVQAAKIAALVRVSLSSVA